MDFWINRYAGGWRPPEASTGTGGAVLGTVVDPYYSPVTYFCVVRKDSELKTATRTKSTVLVKYSLRLPTQYIAKIYCSRTRQLIAAKPRPGRLQLFWSWCDQKAFFSCLANRSRTSDRWMTIEYSTVHRSTN
jgi:hypothetical protein